MSKYIQLSKLDTAIRQFNTAVQLFMTNGDVVSIHSLCSAAHEVLFNLCKKQGIESYIKDQILNLIKEEYHGNYFSKITEAQNFFKHADRDPDGLLKFYPDATAFVLWDSSRMIFSLTNEKPALATIFDVWFYLKHPDTLQDQKYLEACYKLKDIHNLQVENRSSFFVMLPDLQKYSVKRT